MTSPESCDSRIDAALTSRLADFFPQVETWTRKRCQRFLTDHCHDGRSSEVNDLRQQVQEVVQEEAVSNLLSVEALRVFKLCLSWGGPSDYFEIHWSEASQAWTGGRYLFQDWFDGASRSLSPDLTERIADLFGIWPQP